MFLSTLSPKGGKQLQSVIHRVMGGRNVQIKPDEQSSELGDYIVWKVGYAEFDIKRGDGIFIRKSDARNLMKILRKYIVE